VPLRSVGILSPGEMGSGVGAVLHEHGLRVLTVLDGRGPASRARAERAGMVGVDLQSFVIDSDVILSIVPPAAACDIAQQVAAVVRETRANVLYADCNAIAPGTARAVAEIVTGAGARFADAGIIGPPPTRPGNRFFASGGGASDLAQLTQFGLDVRVLQGEVGQASALKMCYAALTKGLQALGAELLAASRLLGVEDTLAEEQNQGDVALIRAFIERSIPSMLPKAYRWVGEMEEIARTFEDVGLPGRIMLGAADVYRDVTAGGLLRQNL
jgi:3-hydroxyisobutyrate dehydrogenase-like beta-hydroxyacid dehydrogenase